MPNQSQQTAESKPKVKKAAAKEPMAAAKEPMAAAKEPKAAAPTPKASRADKPAKAAAPAKNAATPKTRKRNPIKAIHSTNGTHAAPSSVTEVGSSEVQILTEVSHEVSHEMVAVRAYFLAENRRNQGIPGDHSSDWHEAELQVRAEAAAIAASLNHTL